MKVLNYYYPNAKKYEDLTKIDFSEWRGKINVLSAGFPCQPFSSAGRRRGADDDRYLWPQVLRIIKEIRPDYFLGENVAGILSMVFANNEIEVARETDLFGTSNIQTRTEERYIIDKICEDIEGCGYKVQPILIPACSLGAPHRRDRVWFLAHANSTRCESGASGEREKEKQDGVFGFSLGSSEEFSFADASNEHEKFSPNTNSTRLETGKDKRQHDSSGKGTNEQFAGLLDNWERFPLEPSICHRNNGLFTGLSGITVPAWVKCSIRALGNSIVPQIAYEIFRAIEEIDSSSCIIK